MSLKIDESLCQAATVHEAGHIVIACVLNIAINPAGVCICVFANGLARFKGAAPGQPVAAQDVDDTVIAILAGYLAHGQVKDDLKDACKGDENRIVEILEDHIKNQLERAAKREELRTRAAALVHKHWPLIEKVSSTLWEKDWTSISGRSQLFNEKRLRSGELKVLLPDVLIVVEEGVQ
jgi:hypothetical protein